MPHSRLAIFHNFSVLSSVYSHFPTKGPLTVRYFKVCVGRGVDSFPKNGGCPVNSVGACVICISKLTALLVFRQLSVQKLMKIESRHRSLFDPRPARWKLAHSTLGCNSSHRALIPLMHVDRTCNAARLFRMSNPSGIARSRKARCNTRHEHQIARSPLWLSNIRRKIRIEGARDRAKQATREADRSDVEAWSTQMEGYGRPAKPSPRSRNA
jgi:hypothetical protein